MEYRSACLSELANMDQLHPELAADRPELCRPAFPENPIHGGADFPFIFYALEGKKIVGSRKAIPDSATINGKKYPWAWCFDTIVDSSQRGKGVGSRLVDRQVQEFDRLGIISGAAFSAPAMMRIYDKLGYRVLDFTPRMVLVRSLRPFLSERLANGLLLQVVGTFANMFTYLESVWRGSGRSNQDTKIKRLTVEELSQAFAKSSQPNAHNRWASSAEWILARLQPFEEIFEMSTGKSTWPSAIFILREREASSDNRPSGRRLSLTHFEFLSEDSTKEDELSAVLSKELFRRNCDVADIITSSPKLLAALRKRGYRRRGTGMTFVYRIPSGIELTASEDIADWHLTHYCSDGFLFE